MKDRFFELPQEKQQRIINAGYKVFGENSYKKSPVGEIAAEAGISKSLLFYYFKNKKDLYLFLWEQAILLTHKGTQKLKAAPCDNLFDLLESGMHVKLGLMAQYPALANFTVRAFYEKEPEIAAEISKSSVALLEESNDLIVSRLNPDDYIPGVDLHFMYRQIYWASDGCMRSLLQRKTLDAQTMCQEFSDLLCFWRQIFLKPKLPKGGMRDAVT